LHCFVTSFSYFRFPLYKNSIILLELFLFIMSFLHLFITIYPKIVLSTSVSHYILVIYEPHSLLRYIGCINQILLLTTVARLGTLTGFLEKGSET